MPTIINHTAPIFENRKISAKYPQVSKKTSTLLFGRIENSTQNSSQALSLQVKKASTASSFLSVYPVKKIFKNAKQIVRYILSPASENPKRKPVATQFSTKAVSALPLVKGYSRTDSFLGRRDIDFRISSAAFNGNSERLTALLSLAGADPNMRDLQGYNPILWASIRGHLDVTNALLSHPFIDPNARDSNGDTPLHISLRNGCIDIANALLKHPLTDINAQDSNGDTPLHISLRNGCIDVAQTLLLKPKIDVNRPNSKGITPLMIAAMQGDVKNLQKLLQSPAIEINARDKDGNTALMWASATWQIDAINMLMERKDIDLIALNNAGFKAFEIAIRSGDFELSTVLTGDGPKSKQVLEHLEKQLNLFSAEDIKRLLEKGFIPAEHSKALQAMRLLTQFGNMRSLNRLQADLLGYYDWGHPVVSDDAGTLGRTLHYLHQKEYSNSGNKPNPFHRSALCSASITNQRRGAILLDRNMLHQLQNNERLLRHIKENDFIILYADGWIEGVSPFNQSTMESLYQNTQQTLALAKDIASKEHKDEDTALREAISKPTRDIIKSLGLEDNFILLKNKPRIRQKPFSNVQEIAENLEPERISSAEFYKIIASYSDPEYRSAALELLHRNAEVFSPRRLTQFSLEKQKAIEAYAKERKIPSQSIYYLIPNINKSYGVVTMQHLIVNNIPSEQAVTDINAVPPESSMVVILDDIAGSGSSLSAAYHRIKDLYNGPVVISPTISSSSAAQYIKNSCKAAVFIPGKVIMPFKQSDYFKNLSAERKKVFEQLMGSLGYGEDGLSIAFPYMAPDNNNQFFRTKIAPFFTLNGAGIKSY